MSSFLVGLLIELVVGGLLVATIAYCFLLDRRLRALRDGYPHRGGAGDSAAAG